MQISERLTELCIFALFLGLYCHSSYISERAHSTAIGRLASHQKLSNLTNPTECTTFRKHTNLPVSQKFNISCTALAENKNHEIVLGQLKALTAKARNKEMSDSWADVDISTFIQKHSCHGVFDMSKIILTLTLCQAVLFLLKPALSKTLVQ